MMMTERGPVAPAASGSVLAQWETILAAAAPELTGHVQAVGFDVDTGRLDVAPDAPAYGTKVRWIAPKLISAANEQVTNAGVRSLHVLPPAPGKTGPAIAAVDPTSSPTAPTPPVPRPVPSAGYRHTLEAHRQAVQPSRVEPVIAPEMGRSLVQCGRTREAQIHRIRASSHFSSGDRI
ncbi:hypothetical protein ACFT25_16305 [Streptomyces hydrogenans]|uniref:hypothetical protein n=1 Tax=Streptomyces hydrogenans TaxID=1873719 RepID=UPI00362B70ED